jgi:repressor LexA
LLTENLKKYRKKAGISQKKISEMLIMSQQGYAKYETGKASPNPEMLAKIAEILNCTMEELIGTTASKGKTGGIKIPVFGNVAAGIPILAVEDIVDFEEITDELASQGEYFGLVIKGDSMEPRMATGDVVIVRSQPTAETGDIAIVLVDGENATCKKIKRTPEGVMLISLNPAYEPMFYSNKEIQQLPVRILGKVVELRAKF